MDRIKEIRNANICSKIMLVKIFGTPDISMIEKRLSNSFGEVFDFKYINGVLERVSLFPIHLEHVMEALPYLDYDVELLSEQYAEGFISGFIRQVMEFCFDNNIAFTYEENDLKVNGEIMASNNVLYYDIFEIETMLLEFKDEKRLI